jgi:hypothetical protein
MLILDYLLIPALTYVVAPAALYQLYPVIPRWIWIVLFLVRVQSGAADTRCALAACPQWLERGESVDASHSQVQRKDSRHSVQESIHNKKSFYLPRQVLQTALWNRTCIWFHKNNGDLDENESDLCRPVAAAYC